MNAVGEAEDEVYSKKEKQPASEEVVKDKQPKPKKPRFIWTRKVHSRFLEVVEQLGHKKAVPTKILQLMNVEDLTRENVASHLQKFRLQVKRRCREKAQEQAQALAASGNVPKGHMSGISQQLPSVQPNMTQGINIERALLEQSQLAPSFTNHNLNLIREFPTVQDVYGLPLKGLFDEGVNRLSNGPLDINNIGYNFGPLPPKPLFHDHAQSSMDRSYFHDTTLVPQYERHHQLSLADQGIITPSFVSLYDRSHELSLTDPSIISPSFVPQYNRRHESSLSDQGIINPSFVSLYDRSTASPAFVPQYNQSLESSLVDQDIISPSFMPLYDRSQELSVADLEIASYSFVPQYDQHNETSLSNHGIISPSFGPRHDEFSVAEQGIISPSSAQEGLGAGLPHLPVPITTGGQAEGTGGGMPHLLETTEGHGVPLILKETGGHSGMMTEATIVFAGMKVEGPGLDVSFPDEASGSLAWMNDFQQQGCFRFGEEIESATDWSNLLRNL